MKRTLMKVFCMVTAILMLAGCTTKTTQSPKENTNKNPNDGTVIYHQEMITTRNNLLENTWKAKKVVLTSGEEVLPHEFFHLEETEQELGLHFNPDDTFINDYVKTESGEVLSGRIEIMGDNASNIRLTGKNGETSSVVLTENELVQTLEDGIRIYYEKVIPSEEQLIHKYHLTDSLELTDAFYPIEFSLIAKNQIIKENETFESDYTQFEVACSKNEVTNESGEIERTDIVVTLNGIPLDTSIRGTDTLKEDGIINGAFTESVGLIDLDSSDDYKELVVCRESTDHKVFYIFRVEKDGLVQLLKEETKSDSIYHIGNSWIYTNMFNSWIPVSMGYDIYENGTFRHVDRFLNGERVKKEDGMYAQSFQERIIETSEITGLISKIDNMNTQLATGTKFHILGESNEQIENGEFTTTYKIRIPEESSWEKLGVPSGEDELEKIEAGTIIENVIIWE